MIFDKTTKAVRPYHFAACVSLIALFAVSAEAALPTVGPQASITCPEGAVNISPSEDIPSVVDSYPGGTSFCVQAGIHYPASPINLKINDMLVGQYGAVIDGTHVTMTYDIPSTSIIRGWNCPTDCSGVTVRNLVIRNLASYYCIGIYSRAPTASSNNWTIDQNEIYGCKTGVSVSNQSGANVTNNYIHHNIGDPSNSIPSERGGGYGGYSPSNTTFGNNEIAYNGPEQKIFLSVNVTVRNNYVHHNNFSGIWYDGENVNSVIEGNVSEDNPGLGIVYEGSGQGTIRSNTLRRSGLSGIFISVSQNVEIYGNVLEDNYRGIEYFLDCASLGQGGYNTAANGGAGVIYDLFNNNTHDNLVKIGTRSGSLANTLVISNCTSTQSNSYLYGSKNLTFQHNSYYVPSLTAQLWYWGDISRTWSEWQALDHDTTGTVQPASEYAPPVITSTNSATGTIGVAFSYQITATNSPTSFNATGLPEGLSVSTGTGLISGTPTTAATSNVTLSAINALGTGTMALTLTIAATPAPVVTSASTAIGTVGVAFSYQITATGSPTSFSATGLPAGLTVSTGTGLISGTPTTSATSSVTLSATNAGGTGTRMLTLTINPVNAPVITSPSTATGTAGVAFSYQITATNSPTSFNASSLPDGLSVNRNTGLVSGTPANVGTTSNIILRATNAIGTGTKNLILTVNAGLPPAPVITSASTAVGTVGVAFSYQITATNSPTSYNASALPSGLSVNTGTGLVSGTPTTTASSNVNLSAVNAGGTGTAILSLTINAPAPPITLVQSATSIASSAIALSATFPAAVSTGHLIVASVSSWPNAPTGVTDNQGNVYTLATAPKRTSAPGGGSYTATYYARAAGANTVTVRTGGSNGRMSMVIAQFSGVNTMVAADSAISAAGKSQTPSSGNLTPSGAGELLIGAGTHDATTLTTPGSGFTMVVIATENKTTYQPLAMEYRILANTATAATTFSLEASTTWAQTAVLFKR
jgi:parallel beta-helix repeat protein